MKKFLLVCLGFVISISSFSKTHVVQRGETVESIAKTYNITTAQLLEVNPKAKDLFYVGLKLEIPESKNSTIENASLSSSNEWENHSTLPSAVPANNEENAPVGPGWSPSLLFSYGILEKPEGTEGSCSTLSFEASGIYWFMEERKGVFASGGLGYTMSGGSYSIHSFGHSVSYDVNINIISIPIKVGYAFCSDSKKFGITPFLGMGLGITINGKSKYKETGMSEIKTKIKGGKFVPDFRIGVTVRIGHIFNVGGYYAFPLSDDAKAVYQKDGYPNICIAYGF